MVDIYDVMFGEASVAHYTFFLVLGEQEHQGTYPTYTIIVQLLRNIAMSEIELGREKIAREVSVKGESIRSSNSHLITFSSTMGLR